MKKLLINLLIITLIYISVPLVLAMNPVVRQATIQKYVRSPLAKNAPIFYLSPSPVSSPSVVMSPSGRYIAVSSYRQKSSTEGIWIGDRQTGKWKKIWDHVGEIQWMPDESEMIATVGGEGEWQFGKHQPNCTFYRLPLHGRVSQMTILTNVYEWKVIPDASGLVATRAHAQRKRDRYTDIQVEVQVYSFAKRLWHSVHIEAFKWYDSDYPGTHLSIRKHKGDWVINYVEGMTGDNSGLWVNLTTSQSKSAREGSDELEFSPDGHYVVDGNQLFRARSWPLPQLMRDHRNCALKNTILIFSVANTYAHWSPDGRYIAYDLELIKKGSGCIVFNLKGKAVSHPTEAFAGWVGKQQLLLYTGNSYIIRSLDGSSSKEVFRFKWLKN